MWTGKRKCLQETKFGQTMLKKWRIGISTSLFLSISCFSTVYGFFPSLLYFPFLVESKKEQKQAQLSRTDGDGTLQCCQLQTVH
jgi:hypothetical protein